MNGKRKRTTLKFIRIIKQLNDNLTEEKLDKKSQTLKKREENSNLKREEKPSKLRRIS